MLRIKDYIFSFDLLEKKFICDLPVCLGNCCRYGDSGAPLEQEEVLILEEIKETVMPYLRESGISAIMEKGTSLKDFEGDMVTPLIGNEECAYTIVQGNIFMCGIEKAWLDGRTGFRKPLSCHLFPARMKRYRDFTAVNIEEWSICMAASDKGRKEGVYAIEFLKEPLTRALGSEVYDQLCIAAKELRNNLKER